MYSSGPCAPRRGTAALPLAVASYRLISSGPRLTGASVQERSPRGFRQVLFRVMVVQVISLAVLWWLQARYGR